MKIRIFISILLCSGVCSCQKEYLEKKTDMALLIPTTLSDFRNLLDNLDVFNISPSLPVISSDDFYATDAKINAYTTVYQKNCYIWAADIDQGKSIQDWNIPYQQVFYTNVVLDGLKEITTDGSTLAEWNSIRGSALFHRAFAFYNIAQMYAKPFDANTADRELGIPIRLGADVNQKSKRGTLLQTYTQILSDLKEAEELLPLISAFQNRPNKVAAQALLARVYLNMEDYTNALAYAKLSLAQNSTLIDYKTLNAAAASPFPALPANNNGEVLFYSKMTSLTFGISSNTTVNEELYKLYAADDLRKSIFYTTTPYFKGRYTGSSLVLFSGLANDEIYLIKAECEARRGSVATAMDDLNTLLKKRWISSAPYPVLIASDEDDALKKILTERRKELAFRGLRWGDLRRLNKDSRFEITITRTLNGETYHLQPNSNRYTFPIPAQEILLSGMEQNER